MSYKIVATPNFKKEIKRLAKKFHSLKQEYQELIGCLELHPNQGTSLGHDCYKIRLAIASKGKGKSGGARVITYVLVTNNTVFLLTIYDKSEQSDITDKELQQLLGEL
jgi:mRNA-degrading endonuclease RelE of RelBE toxin-antitoxin system